MSRVGVSYWGLLADFNDHRFLTIDTPDGHRYGRPLLIRALQQAGHTVVALQERREPQPFQGVQYASPDLPELDAVFLEWRWSTHKNDARHPDHDPARHEPDLDRQREVISHYRDRCPIIAWDTDFKVTEEDERACPEMVLADPSLRTNRLTRPRASLPFWTDFKELLPAVMPYPILGLVGNNYERPGEFEKFYFAVKQDARLMGVQVSMYGNWLQRSSEREAPESLISTHREVAFNHRMNFYDSMSIMNRFICTTHVSKPLYYETGFVSPRYMEALACNCPALVPRTHLCHDILGSRWIVERGIDVVDRLRFLKQLTVEQRALIIEEQREAFRKKGAFDVKNAVEFIESLC